MPRRVLISFLIVLTGAGGLTAATLDPGKKSTRFQPAQALQPAVLRPAQLKAGAGERRFSGVTIQKITSIEQMPARVELDRTALREARDAKIQPVVQPAANH